MCLSFKVNKSYNLCTDVICQRCQGGSRVPVDATCPPGGRGEGGGGREPLGGKQLRLWLYDRPIKQILQLDTCWIINGQQLCTKGLYHK